MIRLTDEQWERIRKHFPEEHIPDGRAGRKPIPTSKAVIREGYNYLSANLGRVTFLKNEFVEVR